MLISSALKLVYFGVGLVRVGEFLRLVGKGKIKIDLLQMKINKQLFYFSTNIP
jgi:hypothetical protein